MAGEFGTRRELLDRAATAAESLWRNLDRAVEPGVVALPRTRPSGVWSLRAMPVPMPHVWPPAGDGLVDIDVFAYWFDPMIIDAERQAAPFARIVMAVADCSVVDIVSLETRLRPLGLQGFRPSPPELWPSVERAANELFARVKTPNLPTPETRRTIREGYCAFFALNGLIARESRRLHPEFVTWLGCEI